MESDERYSTNQRSERCIGFRFVTVTTMAILSINFCVGIEAWSFPGVAIRHYIKVCSPTETTPVVHSRRDFMTIASALSFAGPLLSDTRRVNADEGESEARQKFVAARMELSELIKDYSEITSKGGGDAVRNRLGTQGVNSNLFGIQKILKTLTKEAEDVVEYTEAMEEFNAYYFQADGAAYQSLFVEHSSAKSTPESLLRTARADIMQMEKYMDELAVQLHI